MMTAPSADGAEYLFFDTFEAREAAFGAAVADLIPVRYQGPQAFWREFRRLSAAPPPGALPAAVASNPRDGLAFGSAHQELAAACVSVRPGNTQIEAGVDTAAERFGLNAALTQPMRTLSGGETVRLALAKAWLSEPVRPELVIASPFTWLSENHLPLLPQTVAAYRAEGKMVRILALRGENDRSPMAACWSRSAPTALPFRLTTRSVRISLGLPINALTAEPATALVQDAALDLTSPCLIAGANGQGKSLLAKALSGAVPAEGRFALESAGAGGRARLLFQDVINQTLLRRLGELAPAALGAAAQTCFESILGRLDAILKQCGAAVPPAAEARGADLLAVKAMLAAVRLAARPAALILDEPDWGLAREAAISLVLAVAEAAHALQVPVLVISHKPWWRPLAQSRLNVAKAPCAAARFEILLNRGEA